MDSEAKKTRNEYFREYRKKHPEKIRAYNAKYWAKRAEQKKQKEGEQTDATHENW